MGVTLLVALWPIACSSTFGYGRKYQDHLFWDIHEIEITVHFDYFLSRHGARKIIYFPLCRAGPGPRTQRPHNWNSNSREMLKSLLSVGRGKVSTAQHSPTFHINWFWSDARRLVVTSLRLIFAMAATKSQPGRDGDEPQPGSPPIVHTTSPLESGEILCRCRWVYWISNFCCGVTWADGDWKSIHDHINFWSLTFEATLPGRKWYWCDICVDGGGIGCICHLCRGVDQRGWMWWTVSSPSSQVPRIPGFLARLGQD